MSYLYLDCETVPHDCVRDFVPVPDLSQIQAAKNLKDPAKIAEDIAKRQAEALAEHESKLARASLDFNLNRIVALGVALGNAEIEVLDTQDEEEEIRGLETLWNIIRDSRCRIVGFCARTFDLPTLIQRSRYLGVAHPQISLARFRGESGDVIDLRDILTFDDMRYDAIMPRSLHMFCRRFGIPVQDETSGADVAQMVRDGNWQAVTDHCKSDIELTRQLAYRVLRNAKPAEQIYERTGEAIL